MRPVLVPSRADDPTQRVGFSDDVFLDVPGAAGIVRLANGNVYVALSIRNVGSGLGVIHGWHTRTDWVRGDLSIGHAPPEEFRMLGRDLYIAPGDTGFWQAAVREPDDEIREPLIRGADAGADIPIDVLYGDHEGIQRWISRFVLRAGEGEVRVVSVVRHWSVDGADPRPHDD
ncbi:MAG: hypothetical protein QOD60_1941 [Solirubrobacterales bacterium]|jgi:hypothetical protein|nr:hypothetical protein [Solirubrobacterales bacterium]